MANSANSTGVLGRRPDILPGGDPFAPSSAAQTQSLADGDITPRITVQIAGDPKGKRPDIKNFSLRADVQQLYDPFRFVLVDDDGQLQWLVDAVTSKILVPIKIFHKDPFVNNGVERPWMQGVITHVDVASGFSGSLVTVSGYDLGFLLTGSAPVGLEYDLKDLSWQRMAGLLIDPSWVQPNVYLGQEVLNGKTTEVFGNNAWGIRSILGVELGRQIRQGKVSPEVAARSLQLGQAQRAQTRGEILAANQVNFFAYTPKVLVQPGQTVADILLSYAKFAQEGNGPIGRLVNMSPMGDLEFFSPDYKTPPQYVANYNRDPKFSDRNNMEDGQRSIDSEGRATDVYCYGSILYGLDFYAVDNPFWGMTEGHFPQSVSGKDFYFRRRQTFSDNERYNDEKAALRARWRYKQGIFNSDTITFTASGHSQNGIGFAPDSRIDVRSDALYCNEIRYVSAVEYRQEDRGDDGIASYTVLTCKKDKLLAA